MAVLSQKGSGLDREGLRAHHRDPNKDSRGLARGTPREENQGGWSPGARKEPAGMCEPPRLWSFITALTHKEGCETPQRERTAP